MKSVYAIHALLLLAISLALRPGLPPAMQDHWGQDPGLFTGLGLLLVSGPYYIDILPMYLVFMAFTPLALAQLAHGRLLAVAAVSVGCWALAQTGLPTALLGGIAHLLGSEAKGITLGIFFDRMGWQILYFAGLAIGLQMARGGLDLAWMRRPAGRRLFFGALALTCGFAALRLSSLAGLIPAQGEALLEWLFERSTLSPLRVLNFASDLYLVAWLLTVGSTDRARPLGAIARGLSRLVHWRPLVFLGQHSLQVYAWHVLMVYVMVWLFAPVARYWPGWLQDGVVLAGVASLWVPAALHDRLQRRARARRQPATSRAAAA